MLEVLVDMAQLASAANNMQNALETYRGAIGNVKSAADALASKWEGDTKEAFVRNQEEAYKWYSTIHNIVIGIIDLVKKVINMYKEAENKVKSIVQG